MSADGRYVAFRSGASNLVAGDANGAFDVFVRDRDTDGDGIFDEPGAVRTQIVSRAATPGSLANMATGNGNSGSRATRPIGISADGRFVSFDPTPTDLVAGDTTGSATSSSATATPTPTASSTSPGPSATVRVSVAATGAQAPAGSAATAGASGSGRYVAFVSRRPTSIPADTNGAGDVYVHDRDTDNDGIFDEAGAIRHDAGQSLDRGRRSRTTTRTSTAST